MAHKKSDENFHRDHKLQRHPHTIININCFEFY
jgi:hypothetical protein